MSTTIRLLLALLMISLAGCGGDDGTAPGTQPDDPVASGTIDADGGEIGDADVTLTVPPGALDDETDLEIYLEDEGQPYGESGEPVYRVGGLPQQLDAPLTVRLRHGGGKDRETVPYLFIGEERESIHGGTGVTWEAVAAVDSSGWMVAHLPRGPYETGDKYDRALWLSPSTIISSVHLVGGHFKVFYLEEEVETARATVVAKTFEQMYDTLYGIGFHFGEQDTIWPLPVMMRKPVAASHAEYWSGPWGKGHFNLETYMALEGNPLREVVLHRIRLGGGKRRFELCHLRLGRLKLCLLFGLQRVECGLRTVHRRLRRVDGCLRIVDCTLGDEAFVQQLLLSTEIQLRVVQAHFRLAITGLGLFARTRMRCVLHLGDQLLC